MKIGIIGAGHIGGTLARRLTALGHDVSVANSRGPETLRDISQETGAKAVALRDDVRGKDLVIVSIPERAVRDLPKDLFTGDGKTIVIDTGNYYPQRDGRIDPIEDGMPESQWVAQELGHTVVKAFNNIYAKNLMENGRPAGDGKRIALPIAGDDPAAKATVLRLLDQLGFDGVDAGELADSWRQEPGTPVYGTDLDVEGVKHGLAAARHERSAAFRAQ
jgi:predicted dinucleotide-binding enzyme